MAAKTGHDNWPPSGWLYIPLNASVRDQRSSGDPGLAAEDGCRQCPEGEKDCGVRPCLARLLQQRQHRHHLQQMRRSTLLSVASLAAEQGGQSANVQQTQQTRTWMRAAAAIVALTILKTLLGMSDLTTAVCTWDGAVIG